MSSCSILFAGFGGQGILFAGKFVAYKGLIEGKHVSWLPSYGPEMRGGTANCSVIVSDEEIGSPVISRPDVLVAMNLPSLTKYENDVKPGGYIFIDSALISSKVERDDVTVVYIPASQIASDENMATLANMIITGNLLKNLDYFSTENLEPSLKKVVSARHQDLLGLNLKALEIGINY